MLGALESISRPHNSKLPQRVMFFNVACMLSYETYCNRSMRQCHGFSTYINDTSTAPKICDYTATSSQSALYREIKQ